MKDFNIDQAKQKLISWVSSQVGKHEGENNWTEYAEDPRLKQLYGVNLQNQPWCDLFTDEAFVSVFGLELGAAMTYQAVGSGSAACRTSAQFFINHGAFVSSPEVGDIVFFFYDGAINHQGIVIRVYNGSIVTVEGNSADMVAERFYDTADRSIAGYGRPLWELAASERKENANMRGVDISNYQKGLTIQQLMDDGKDFAILKITEGTYHVDASAFAFYKEAYDCGFPVGGYCYSHATNAQQAMAEAAFLIDTIKGFPMPCGVFLDMEEESQIALPKETLLNVIRGWCAGIGGKGYIPGVYSSEGTLWEKISPDELPPGTLIWVAKWSESQPGMRCDVWQNSDSGSITGYSGPVDTDCAMSEYFQTLVSIADYKKPDAAKVEPEPTQSDADLVPDACPIEPVDPFVMCLQFIMSYKHKWDKPDGKKSPEFFKVLRQFVDELERGDSDGQ